MDFTFSPKASKLIWLVYTFLAVSVIPTLLVAFPEGTPVPKWVVLTIAGVNSVGAFLRMLTTNSFLTSVPEIPKTPEVKPEVKP